MTFRVTVSPVARTDAERIFAWLQDRSPAGAASWLEAFQTAVVGLEQMALQHGRAAEERKLGREVRETFFKTRRGHNYRLLYRVKDDEVRVLRVRGPASRRCDAVIYREFLARLGCGKPQAGYLSTGRTTDDTTVVGTKRSKLRLTRATTARV